MTISDTLRAAVHASDDTRAAIARAAGVTESTLSRFMSGRGGLYSVAADRLAEHFGLALLPMATGTVKKKTTTARTVKPKKRAPRRKAGG